MRRFLAFIVGAQHQCVIKVPVFPLFSTLELYARNKEWDEVKHLRTTCHLYAVHGLRNVVLRSHGSREWRPVFTQTTSLETFKLSFLRKVKLFLASSKALDPFTYQD